MMYRKLMNTKGVAHTAPRSETRAPTARRLVATAIALLYAGLAAGPAASQGLTAPTLKLQQDPAPTLKKLESAAEPEPAPVNLKPGAIAPLTRVEPAPRVEIRKMPAETTAKSQDSKPSAAALRKQAPAGAGGGAAPSAAVTATAPTVDLKKLGSPNVAPRTALAPSVAKEAPGLTGRPGLTLQQPGLRAGAQAGSNSPGSGDLSGITRSPAVGGSGAAFGNSRSRTIGGNGSPTAPGGFGAARLNRSLNRADVIAGGPKGVENESLSNTSMGMASEQEAAASLGMTVDQYRRSEQSEIDSTEMSIDARPVNAGPGDPQQTQSGGINRAYSSVFGSRGAAGDTEQAAEDAMRQGAADDTAGDQQAQADAANSRAGEGEMTFTEEEARADQEQGDNGDGEEMTFTEEEAQADQDQGDGGDEMTFTTEEAQAGSGDDGCGDNDPNCSGGNEMTVGGDEQENAPPPPGGCGEGGANCTGGDPDGGNGTLRMAEGQGQGGPLAGSRADPGIRQAGVDINGQGGIDRAGLDGARIEAALQERINPSR